VVMALEDEGWGVAAEVPRAVTVTVEELEATVAGMGR